MGFKKAPKKTRTLEEMAGIEIYRDSSDREWFVKVFSLGEQHKFFHALRVLLIDIEQERYQTYFMQRILYSDEPNIWHKIRALFGLPVYSFKHIAKNIPARDFEKLLDAVFKANLDQDFVSYMEKLTNDIKKKKVAMTN